MRYVMKTYFQSDIGLVRTCNEDSANIFNNNEQVLAIVADGMGGHRAGEIASSMAVENFEKAWHLLEKPVGPAEAEKWLVEQIESTNKLLFTHASDHNECEGMGTTVVVALCSSEFTTIAHIGDSRCYILGKNGLQQITEDHSYVNYLLKTGGISKEDAEHHPRKNVLTKALGTKESVTADIKTFFLESDDLLLLCTDGLYTKVEDQEIARLLVADENLSSAADYLISKAKENGGEDNISVVLLQQTALESEGNRL